MNGIGVQKVGISAKFAQRTLTSIVYESFRNELPTAYFTERDNIWQK